MGLWPRTGSTHPLSEAYHRCCRTLPGLLTNNMNFCRLFLFPVLFPFNSNLISLSLLISLSSLPSYILNSGILKAQTPAPSELTLRPSVACSLGSLLPFFFRGPAFVAGAIRSTGLCCLSLGGSPRERDTPLVGTMDVLNGAGCPTNLLLAVASAGRRQASSMYSSGGWHLGRLPYTPGRAFGRLVEVLSTFSVFWGLRGRLPCTPLGRCLLAF